MPPVTAAARGTSGQPKSKQTPRLPDLTPLLFKLPANEEPDDDLKKDTGAVSLEQFIRQKETKKKQNHFPEKDETRSNCPQVTPPLNVDRFDNSAGTAIPSVNVRDAISNPELIEATTCWIAAEHALCHVRDNTLQLSEIFSRYRIRESDYAVHAGFDESLIQAGVGYLEQIHVFTSAKVTSVSSLLSELGTVLSPFSAILFTESCSYTIPVLKEDGNTWIFDELVHVTASKFIDGGSSATRPPTVISLSGTSGEAGAPNISSQEHDEDGKEKPDPREGREREKQNDNGANNGDENNGDTGEDPHDPEEDPADGGGEALGSSKISFDIVSEIYSIHDNASLFQSLTTEGTLTIQRTPLNLQRSEFPKCQIQFTKLKLGTQRTTGSTSYRQFHLRITVDPQQKNADVTVVKPQRTLAFEKELKESSARKASQTLTAMISATLGIQPQATITGMGAWTSEVTIGSEKKRYTSRITQQTKYGVVWWGFNVNDPYEQEGGVNMSESILPSVDFQFLGTSNVPAPPPERMDIEIASYWSMMSGPREDTNWIRNIISKASKTGSYSNLCQIVTLGVSSDSSKQSEWADYRATLHIKPGYNNSRYSTEVRRQTGDVEVTPAVSWGQDPAYVESEDLQKLSVLKLPTLTKVALLEDPAKQLESSGSTSHHH